jgi:hypothetical protein
VDGLATPLHRPMVHSRLPRGQGFPMRCRLVLSRWWLVMFVRGKGSFPGRCCRLEVLTSLVPVYGVSHSKMGFYRAVITSWQGHDGYKIPGQENKVCRLRKSLYGLNKYPNNGMKKLTPLRLLLDLLSMKQISLCTIDMVGLKG